MAERILRPTSIEVQQAVMDVCSCASEAKKIAEEADRLSRELCPALVRWSAKSYGNWT